MKTIDFLTSSKLSNKELEIIQLVANEFSTREIASKLYVSFETIKSHRKNLFKKLQVKNAAGLVRVAYERKLIAI